MPGTIEKEKDDCRNRAEKQNRMEVQKNGTLLLFAVLFLFGTGLGIIYLTNSNSQINAIVDFMMHNSAVIQSNSILSVFTASMASSFFYLFLSFLFGLTLWGTVLQPILPLLRGFGYGLSAGYLCITASHGWLTAILLLLLGSVLSAFALFYSCAQGTRFSRRIRQYSKKTSHAGQFPSITHYAIRCGIIGILGMIAAIADSICCLLFSGMIQPQI